MKSQFTIGVFAIILDSTNKVLLCHRLDYDLWNLPGGGLEIGESPWGAVIREVKEETGLSVEIIRLGGVYSKPKKDEIVFSFVCHVTGGRVTLNSEADKIEYFHFQDLPTNTSPKHVERVKDALENETKTIFKIQTGKSSFELIKEGKLKTKIDKF